MLTTIGDQILEIRPKQIIELSEKVENDYLVLIEEAQTKPKKGRPKKVKNEELPK
tara:strand:+ start:2621 stop:2785 length:165 start_codon:yes stop_codon:yes gene_type:complete